MNEDASNWIQYLNNRVALNNIFSGKAPALDRLDLDQLVIEQAGAVHISLNLPSLPPSSPSRWVDRGCDAVQLRLSFFYLDQISITGAFDDDVEVAASFGERYFSISNPQFKVELKYRYVEADLYPFDSRIFEEPRKWYHQ